MVEKDQSSQKIEVSIEDIYPRFPQFEDSIRLELRSGVVVPGSPNQVFKVISMTGSKVTLERMGDTGKINYPAHFLYSGEHTYTENTKTQVEN